MTRATKPLAVTTTFVYLIAVILVSIVPSAFAQFSLEDVVKVQEGLKKKYPKGGDKEDLYREIAASEEFFVPVERSMLAPIPLLGHVKTVTGGPPSFYFASTLESTISGSTMWEEVQKVKAYTFPSSKGCGQFEVLLWVDATISVTLQAQIAKFRVGLEAQGYTYRPARVYNEFVNEMSGVLTEFRPKVYLALLKKTDLKTFKRDLLKELKGIDFPLEQTEGIRAAKSKKEMARILARLTSLGEPTFHIFAAQKGRRILAGFWSGSLPEGSEAGSHEGISLVWCELSRSR